MPLKDFLRAYLEGLADKDEAIREKYSPDKMEQCLAYVNDEARKLLKSRSGAVEDTVVFKWAREFFLEMPMAEERKNTESRNEARVAGSGKAKKDPGFLYFDFYGDQK